MRGNAESWLNHLGEDTRENYPLVRAAFLAWFDDKHHLAQVRLLMESRTMDLSDDMDEYVGEMMMGAQQCNMNEEGLLAALMKGFSPCMRADMMM